MKFVASSQRRSLRLAATGLSQKGGRGEILGGRILCGALFLRTCARTLGAHRRLLLLLLLFLLLLNVIVS